jgi:hypothetical protein
MGEARNKHRLAARQVRLPVLASHRMCGECTACCTVMAVKEIGKLQDVTCEHVCAEGCSIYTNRPSSCRDFNCLWRYEFGEFGDRPDKLGLVFHPTGQSEFGQFICVREVWPGAIEAAQSRLDAWVAAGHVFIFILGDQRRLLGLPEKVEPVRAKMLQRFGQSW